MPRRATQACGAGRGGLIHNSRWQSNAFASSEVVDQFVDFGLPPGNSSLADLNRSRVQTDLDSVIERRAGYGKPLENVPNAQQTFAWGDLGCGTHGESFQWSGERVMYRSKVKRRPLLRSAEATALMTPCFCPCDSSSRNSGIVSNEIELRGGAALLVDPHLPLSLRPFRRFRLLRWF